MLLVTAVAQFTAKTTKLRKSYLLFILMSISISIHIYIIYIHTHTHAHMHICTHACTYILIYMVIFREKWTLRVKMKINFCDF